MPMGDPIDRRRASREEQQGHLRAEIGALGADPDSDVVAFFDDAGFGDRSHSTEERSRLISVARALRSNLRDVDRALGKIDAGSYGRCERCGTPISADRLEALPWAMLCIDCKQRGAGA
jgi:RNA polymerase-binding transcription factor DksA